MSSASRRANFEGLRWTPELEVLFIDIMYEEVIRGNLLGSTFTNNVWTNIQNALKTRVDMNCQVRQLREKLTRIKSNWRKYKDIMLYDTGLGWDHERDVPIADAVWWNLYLQKYPQDSCLRNKPCRRYIKLCTMFERNTATGSRARSSAQLPPDPMEEDEQALSDGPLEVDEDLPSQSVPTRSGHSRRRRARQPGYDDRVIESFQTSTQTISSALSDGTKQDCKDVMAALRQIPGLGVVKRVKVADYYAKKKLQRQMFLACDPEEREAYVKLIPAAELE